MNNKDYYKTLGVEKNATEDEIKKAFRQTALKHHPDRNPGNKEAETKFKEASEAYSVLSDKQKRAQYDQFGSAGMNGFGGGAGGGQGFGGFDFSGFDFGSQGGNFEFDLGDIFGDLFGGGRGGARKSQRKPRGQDIQIDISLDFKDAIFGVEKEIDLYKHYQCEKCSGTGAKNNETKTCTKCGGSGQVVKNVRSIFGTMQQATTCDECNGLGKIPKERCSECRGAGIKKENKKIKVDLPSGLEDSQQIRVSGYGEMVPHGTAGDLYIKISVKHHKTIIKKGHNLESKLTIKLTEALLGSEREIETLDGKVTIKIPQGSNTGDTLRLRNKGVPLNNNSQAARGDFMIHLDVLIPKHISRATQKIVEELKREGV